MNIKDYLCKKFQMDRVYHLSSCSTCQKILASLPENDLEKIDIRQSPLTEQEVDELASMAGSYEAIFSRKAVLYRTLGLKDKALSEQDYRKYLLEHYTFLRRPVFVIGGKIFIGNSNAAVNGAIEAIG